MSKSTKYTKLVDKHYKGDFGPLKKFMVVNPDIVKILLSMNGKTVGDLRRALNRLERAQRKLEIKIK